MNKKEKWVPYLYIGILLALAFLVEYLSIFLIVLPDLIQGNTIHFLDQKIRIHHIFSVILWIIYCGGLLYYSHKKYDFPKKEEAKKISAKNWFIAALCLLGCKGITVIDWHTLKMIGEANIKVPSLLLTQYLYYFAEVIIVLLIIMFGQKAWEVRNQKQSYIPAGGILLMFTWGIFHFISRGKGIEVWNGISTMIVSLLSGVMYVRLEKKIYLSYLFIAIAYLL